MRGRGGVMGRMGAGALSPPVFNECLYKLVAEGTNDV